MGITGLLPLLREITESTTLEKMDLKGKRIAFDAMALLHRGAIACAREVCLSLPTTKHITFCRSIIRLFADRGISPRDMFMVFDNPCSGPLKIETNEARRQGRVLALEKAIAEERIKGITPEVMSLYRQAISITKVMIESLHHECLEMGLCAVVAPTEADSTLAYLSLSDAVDYIVGEDSDLLVFGAKACIYKLVPSTGSCDVVRSEHLGRVFPRWTSERFLLFCILCGCDYLKISGVGPKTAFKIVLAHPTLAQVKGHLRAYYKASQADLLRLSQAFLTFQHSAPLHLLSPLPPDHVLRKLLDVDASRDVDCSFLGKVESPVVETRQQQQQQEQEQSARGPANADAYQSQPQQQGKDVQWQSKATVLPQSSSHISADWGFEFCDTTPNADAGDSSSSGAGGAGARKPRTRRRKADVNAEAEAAMGVNISAAHLATKALAAFQISRLSDASSGANTGFVSLRRQLFNSRSGTATRSDGLGARVDGSTNVHASTAITSGAGGGVWPAASARRDAGGGSRIPMDEQTDAESEPFFEPASFFQSASAPYGSRPQHCDQYTSCKGEPGTGFLRQVEGAQQGVFPLSSLNPEAPRWGPPAELDPRLFDQSIWAVQGHGSPRLYESSAQASHYPWHQLQTSATQREVWPQPVHGSEVFFDPPAASFFTSPVRLGPAQSEPHARHSSAMMQAHDHKQQQYYQHPQPQQQYQHPQIQQQFYQHPQHQQQYENYASPRAFQLEEYTPRHESPHQSQTRYQQQYFQEQQQYQQQQQRQYSGFPEFAGDPRVFSAVDSSGGAPRGCVSEAWPGSDVSGRGLGVLPRYY